MPNWLLMKKREQSLNFENFSQFRRVRVSGELFDLDPQLRNRNEYILKEKRKYCTVYNLFSTSWHSFYSNNQSYNLLNFNFSPCSVWDTYVLFL